LNNLLFASLDQCTGLFMRLLIISLPQTLQAITCQSGGKMQHLLYLRVLDPVSAGLQQMLSLKLGKAVDATAAIAQLAVPADAANTSALPTSESSGQYPDKDNSALLGSVEEEAVVSDDNNRCGCVEVKTCNRRSKNFQCILVLSMLQLLLLCCFCLAAEFVYLTGSGRSVPFHVQKDHPQALSLMSCNTTTTGRALLRGHGWWTPLGLSMRQVYM
jgi:hypothetical protein